MYELESLGIKIDKEDDEESILQFMNNYRSTIQMANGKITAGFPFLSNVPRLKDNFNGAIKRLHALLRVLQQDPQKMGLHDNVLSIPIRISLRKSGSLIETE
ncbi:hypothetical protein ANCCAN_12659 [Ancylostoma caninum]|uniref:Uncharacterized protein n=1 Tax=Ancylostoma caninum TaxID=29170 RepID=A0A368GAJ4_ANCCA|nr:hypothetical protein ANCCAN_12659 [Ancylostoma caninum]